MKCYSSLTFVATANAVKHSGGVPHFVDVDENNFGVCPVKLENYLKKITFKKMAKFSIKELKSK